MQMTTAQAVGAVSGEAKEWYAIDWPTIERNVRRLQVRIAQATKEGRWGKVRALQHLLTHSFSGKVFAVRRVTENNGKKTPGVLFPNRVSLKEAFEVLEPDDGKLSRPVLRGPGPSDGVRLLGHFVHEPSHSSRGSSAGSHTPRLRMVCSQLRSYPWLRFGVPGFIKPSPRLS
jgi:N-terminal domain of reverse transcriptase